MDSRLNGAAKNKDVTAQDNRNLRVNTFYVLFELSYFIRASNLIYLVGIEIIQVSLFAS